MIWYKEVETPDEKQLVVQRELLSEFKKFCKEEFMGNSHSLYGDFERFVESNIFLKDFEFHDKEYLKMLLGMLKQLGKDFTKENIETVLSIDRLSSPPSIIHSAEECNYFVLKKACEYVSFVQPAIDNKFTWIEVIQDIKLITIPYYVSEDFLIKLNKTKEKIMRVVSLLDEISKEDEELNLTILVKPLMLTRFVLDIQADKRDLFLSLISQGVIHPAMKIPKNDSVAFTSNIFLEHLIEKPLKSTMWYVKESIVCGDDWIDYSKMYEYYSDFYEKIMKPLSDGDALQAKVKIYEENLEVIKAKYLKQKIMEFQNYETPLDSETDDSDFKI